MLSDLLAEFRWRYVPASGDKPERALSDEGT
jgi:hypothetical protein